MEKSILKKISTLNDISMSAIMDDKNSSIISKFSEESLNIFGADFVFAFVNENSEPVYKSSKMTFEPKFPKRKNRLEGKNESPFLDSDVKKENYEENFEKYFKSYIIVPIRYGGHSFGNIIICYKNKHKFTEEELLLAGTAENMVSRAVNINWLVEKENRSLALAEKQKSIEVLLSQEKTKTEFIANATHELQTPLAIMKGNVDLALMNKDTSKSTKENLEEINTEINKLSSILKDLALLTSSEQNTQAISEPLPIDLNDLLNSLVKRLKTVAFEKNIAIKIRNSKSTDAVVSGDDKHLEKLFLNLIKNAITYGKKDGHIDIEVAKNKENVEVNIKDDGIGISKEDLPNIFERFYRGDKAHTHTDGHHSGLGLAIAKWAADIHGGKLEAESSLGKGSTFTVTLPRIINS